MKNKLCFLLMPITLLMLSVGAVASSASNTSLKVDYDYSGGVGLKYDLYQGQQCADSLKSGIIAPNPGGRNPPAPVTVSVPFGQDFCVHITAADNRQCWAGYYGYSKGIARAHSQSEGLTCNIDRIELYSSFRKSKGASATFKLSISYEK